ALVMVLTFKFSVYGGYFQDGTARELLVGENYLLMIVAAVLVLLPILAIISFKNRGNQKKLIWLTILLQLVFIVLVWMEATSFSDKSQFIRETYKPGAIVPIAAIILLALAYRGIRHDEKLIKSAERLR
ncbi:MAG TPA: DUF4293 family protein, partial [Phnomibacter sp.]|nr:DUF4293 family protein [Phnomibacter sp.]